MKEQLERLQKIAKELNDAVIGLQAEYAYQQNGLRDLQSDDNPTYKAILHGQRVAEKIEKNKS